LPFSTLAIGACVLCIIVLTSHREDGYIAFKQICRRTSSQHPEAKTTTMGIYCAGGTSARNWHKWLSYLFTPNTKVFAVI